MCEIFLKKSSVLEKISKIFLKFYFRTNLRNALFYALLNNMFTPFRIAAWNLYVWIIVLCGCQTWKIGNEEKIKGLWNVMLSKIV